MQIKIRKIEKSLSIESYKLSSIYALLIRKKY